MKGITFNQVREVLTALTNEIPATDEVCTEFTMSCGPGYVEEIKGKDRVEKPDFYFMTAKVGKIKIDLRVFGTMLLSESDEQLAKGEYV